MLTLLVLCSVIASQAVQGADLLHASEAPITQDPTETEIAQADSRACGGYLYNMNGTFQSPNYPNAYPSNTACTWYIRPGSGIVQLDFPFMDIENHHSCDFDALYIYDGLSTANTLLGKVCGKKNPTFHSTGSYLTVHFKSDHVGSHKGFRATYQVVGSCRNNCGNRVGNCSCSSYCKYNGDCCSDFSDHCSATSAPVTAQPSCRYNCGNHLGSCSCSSSCRYYGNCCHDYSSYCESTTAAVEPTSDPGPSCRYNCGYYMGSCSCSSSCRYYGNCCHDYSSYCESTTAAVEPTSDPGPSCRYNCGYYMGSCSCSSSCRYNGNCCHDYSSYCQTSTSVGSTADQPSCRHYCGSHMGSCSCSSSCRYYGNCCHDYSSYCESTAEPTTAQPSCRYNCGSYMGSCSCTSSCRYNGNCCYDYYSYCPSGTVRPTPDQPSCRYNCGRHMGNCSCSSSCRYNGNCCYDYYSYCQSGSVGTTADQPSCRHYCGSHMGSCSCSSSCRYYGNCCHDYSSYCESNPVPTTAQPSCRYNCGSYMGSCSCTSSCRYNGNCCHDYSYYCSATTDVPATGGSCGGSQFGSGTISSPNHPSYYHDNSYCTYQLRAAFDQRIALTFTYLQLENCCSCDYISIYDGSSINSGRYLGKVCQNDNNTLNTFYSSSNYMTVVFRSDGSLVGQGFKAEFMSVLPQGSGRVDCSSDNMNIVIERSYLNSVGYDGHSLYLNDPHCRPQVSYYQVVFSFPLNTCGNVRKFENGRPVYTNSIRAFASNSGEITRQSFFKINVGCRMEQDSVAQIMYIAHHSNSSDITGTGRFNTTMDFYTSSSFYYKVSQVPYEVTLNQYLYVQVDLRRGDSTLALFLDTCVASPSPHDFHTRSYYLVRNGCNMDSTYYAYVSGTRPYARFRFKAFQFLRATDSVYIQCKVLICQATDYSSRCRRGCMRRAARDVGSGHDSQTVVLGPIQLKEAEKKAEGTGEEVKA